MIDLLQKSSSMCEDIAWGWMLTLFGAEGTGCTMLGGLPAADLNSPYANAFAVLTASLAFIGSIFLAYHVLAGIVSSAYTGKVLGERWHQIWAPLRVVFGFGLLIPIGDGFSAVHYILRDVVGLAAVNLGNAVISVYVQTAFDPSTDYIKAKITTNSGGDIAGKFFAAEICTGIIKENTSNRFLNFGYKAWSPTSHKESSTGYHWQYGVCGTISQPRVIVDGSDGVFSFDEIKEKVDSYNNIRLQATKELQQTIAGLMDYQALGKFLNTNATAAATSNEALVEKLREDGIIGVGIQDKVDAAVEAWNTKIGNAASSVFAAATQGGRNGALSNISKYGFMAAGSYERTLSAAAAFTTQIATAGVTSTTADVDEAVVKKIMKASGIVSSSKAIDNNDREDGIDVSADSNTGRFEKLMQSILPTNLFAAYYGTTSLDPVGDMIVFGNSLLTYAGYVIMGLIAIKAGGWIAGVVAGFMTAGGPAGAVAGGVFGVIASSVLDALFGWIVPIIIGMVLIGLMHSFVLPMIPFIMVFIMGISWLLMFLEGAIAAVLWAFVFIRMDGNEFADQKQSPGVSLLFNLLLRPALGMLAFCGMILLLPALLNGLNVIWGIGFMMQTGEHTGLSLVGAYQILALAVIFAWMQWTITLRLASLIPSIADRVGHWMGMSSTSGYSDGMETGAAVAGAVAATQAVNSGIRGTLGNSMKGKNPNEPGISDKIRGAREAKAIAKAAANNAK